MLCCIFASSNGGFVYLLLNSYQAARTPFTIISDFILSSVISNFDKPIVAKTDWFPLKRLFHSSIDSTLVLHCMNWNRWSFSDHNSFARILKHFETGFFFFVRVILQNRWEKNTFRKRKKNNTGQSLTIHNDCLDRFCTYVEYNKIRNFFSINSGQSSLDDENKNCTHKNVNQIDSLMPHSHSLKIHAITKTLFCSQ